mmetsp:Transcript_4172/g.5375  ORF Transcript_4172/g.5375 Transcript_4172/m.5375 type:complete len:794 (-) Transcript_4172:187-2568(-)
MKKLSRMKKQSLDTTGFSRPQTPARKKKGSSVSSDSEDDDDDLLTTPIHSIFKASPKPSPDQAEKQEVTPTLKPAHDTPGPQPVQQQTQEQGKEGESLRIQEGVTRVEMLVDGLQHYEGLVTKFDNKSPQELYTILYDEDGEKEKLSAKEVQSLLVLRQDSATVGATPSRKIKVGESRIRQVFEVQKYVKGTVISHEGGGEYKVLWDVSPAADFKPFLPTAVFPVHVIEEHIIQDDESLSESDSEFENLSLEDCFCTEEHRVPQPNIQRKKKGRITEKFEVSWEGKENCGVCLLDDGKRKGLIVHGILPSACTQICEKLSPGDVIQEINDSKYPDIQKEIFYGSEEGSTLIIRLHRGKDTRASIQHQKKKRSKIEKESREPEGEEDYGEAWPWEKIQLFSRDFVWYKCFPCRIADVSEASVAKLLWPFPEGTILVQFLEERRQYALAPEEDLLPFDEGEIEEGRKGVTWSTKLIDAGFKKYRKRPNKSLKGHVSGYTRPGWDRLMKNAQQMLQDALLNDHNSNLAASSDFRSIAGGSPPNRLYQQKRGSRKRARSASDPAPVEQKNEGKGRGRMSIIKTKERLRPTDVVAYYDKVSSMKIEESIVQVKKGKSPYILLTNGDRLEEDDQLQKVKRFCRGKLVTVENGTMLPLEQYKLETDPPKGATIRNPKVDGLYQKMQQKVIHATQKEFPDMPVADLFWGASRKGKKKGKAIKNGKQKKEGKKGINKKGAEKTKVIIKDSVECRLGGKGEVIKKNKYKTKNKQKHKKMDVFEQLEQNLRSTKEEMPFPMTEF